MHPKPKPSPAASATPHPKLKAWQCLAPLPPRSPCFAAVTASASSSTPAALSTSRMSSATGSPRSSGARKSGSAWTSTLTAFYRAPMATNADLELARQADRIELAAFIDMYAAAPSQVQARVETIADATLLLAPALPLGLFNRAI